jgi:tight adherence protein C
MMGGIQILCVIGLSLALLHFSARGHVRRLRMLRRLEDLAASPAEADDGKNRRGRFEEWQAWLKPPASILARGKEYARVAERMRWAGFRLPWHADLFFTLKLLLFLAVALTGFFWLEIDPALLLKKPLTTAKYLLLLFLAARAPDWWLADQIKKRRAKIRLTVPQALDLMILCVESGVSLEEAFGRVAAEIERRAPEIAQELRITRSEMLISDRSEALRRMKNRSGVAELDKLAAALLQSLQYGTPIVQALANIAAESRADQVAEMEEKAGSISARVSIPLILLILFPLVALIAAPAAINLMRAFK